MSDERFKMPPERDFGFYQRRKHDKWRAVEPPQPSLEAAVADSHAHVHLLPDPAWELARCIANGVDFLCMIVDPSEDGAAPFDSLDGTGF
jgi:TatD DNase family protein